jgi:hypothetical protein
MAHTIRLRGAWNLEKQTAPGGGYDLVRLKREFGYSSGLKSASRVWLAITTLGTQATAELNGRALGRIDGQRDFNDKGASPGPSRFDVTAVLQPRNTLTIQFSLPELQPEERSADDWAGVRLEIEE